MRQQQKAQLPLKAILQDNKSKTTGSVPNQVRCLCYNEQEIWHNTNRRGEEQQEQWSKLYVFKHMYHIGDEGIENNEFYEYIMESY